MNSTLDIPELRMPDANPLVQAQIKISTEAAADVTIPERIVAVTSGGEILGTELQARAASLVKLTPSTEAIEMQRRYDAEIARIACLPPAARGPMIAAVAKEFMRHKGSVNADVRKTASAKQAATEMGDDTKIVYISQDVALGERVRQIHDLVADKTFVSAGTLCRQNRQGGLDAFTEGAFAVFVDNKDGVRFATTDPKTGDTKLTAFDSKNSGFVLESIPDASNPRSPLYNAALRPVMLQTDVPICYRTSEGQFAVAEGYNREMEILAGECDIKRGMSLAEAAAIVDRIVDCYNPATQGDRQRFRAMIIAPALIASNILPSGITSKSPLWWVHKAALGAGSSYIVNLIGSIYAQTPFCITMMKNPQKTEDKIESSIRSGRQLILLDNVSEKSELEQFESLKTMLTSTTVVARTLYAQPVEVDVSKRVLFGTSNGANIGPELASRCFSLKVLNWPADHKWTKFDEGEITHHIEANRGLFLGAIFRLIKEYLVERESNQHPITGKTMGHRFSAFERAMSWIIEAGFDKRDEAAGRPIVPLLDGQKEAMEMISDPMADNLLKVFRMLDEGQRDRGMMATSISDMMVERDVVKGKTVEQIKMHVAAKLKALFPQKEPGNHVYSFAGGEWKVRVTVHGTDSNEHRYYQPWRYSDTAPAEIENRNQVSKQTRLKNNF